MAGTRGAGTRRQERRGEVTHGDIVGGEEAGEAAGAVLDGELGPVRAVTLRLRAVILVVQDWQHTIYT